jgi:hypothetical protein
VNRKILAINLVLLALLGTLGWMLRAHWRETRARELATLSKAARRIEVLPPPSPTPPETAVPANYLDVAQKTLFSKDRNPNVIVEVAPPPAPKPEEPTPPRPFYYGQMGLGPEPVALLSVEKGGQKGFHVGDEVGPFKLMAFNRETITFEWNGKTLEYPLAELKPKEPQAAQQAAAAAAAAAAPSKPQSLTPAITIVEDKPTLGTQNGEIRSCVTGDKSPAGTVKDGFRKSVVNGPFGPMCQWEPIK